MKINQQTEFNECGLLILQSLYKFFYHKKISLSFLHSLSDLKDNGISLKEMVNLGAMIGIKIVFYKMDKQEFNNYMIINPMISLIKTDSQQHFVIVYKKNNKYIYYSDPETGKNYKVKRDSQFSKKMIYIFGIVAKNNSIILKNKIKNTVVEFTKEYFSDLIIVFLINIILISLTIFASIFSKVLIDYIIPNKLIINLLIISAFFVMIHLFKNIVTFIQSRILQNILLNFHAKLYQKFLLNLDKKDYNFNNNFKDSSIIRKTQLIGVVSNFIVVKIITLFSNIFLFIALFIFLFFIFNIFALVLLIFLCLFLLINTYLKFNSESLIKIQQNNIKEELNNRLPLIYLRKNLKTGNKHKFIKDVWWKSFVKLQNNTLNIISFNNKRTLLNDSFIVIINFLFITVSSILIIKENLSTGTIIIIISVLSFMWNPLTYFSNFINSLNKDILNYNEVSKILNAPNEDINKNGFAIKKITKISIIKLNFSYNQKTIFKNMNLLIDKHLFINAKNGTGKSTLLRIISGIEKTIKTIKINNQYLENINLQHYRQNIILLTNQYDFINQLISELKDPQKSKYWFSLFAKYHMLIIFKNAKINLLKITKNNYHNLSLGQKQILNFLILFKKLYLLILIDEVLSNVEYKINHLLFSILLKFQKDALVIIASHHKNPNPQKIKQFNFKEFYDIE